MDNWFKLHIPVLILSWSYPPSAFVLLPIFILGDIFIFLKTF